MALALLKCPKVDMPAGIYAHFRDNCPDPYKVPYQTEGDANYATARINARRPQSATSTNIAPYRCRCGVWHVSDARRVRVLGKVS
ncbi:hypothetical protein FDH96_gp130 [Mycobacterium phage Rey]|uniref:Uncharacterized protein n=1 Tax=Mycobacterium phage Rey TaxID=1034115 RepID=G1D5I9_9CAUD|nr:hypothetical protein FDH96_gp130 [Mycobacterium phage Rey]AEK10037.1 hypothetical protein PBI_REY_149 [Mycobacterium phage Rey]